MGLSVEQHLVCPKCGSDQYDRMDGIHIFNKHRCLECSKAFRQPISETSYQLQRKLELEGSIRKLIDTHPEPTTLKALKDMWSFIPKYAQVENQQEDDFCKAYLRDQYRIRRLPKLRFVMERLMKEHMVIPSMQDLYDLISVYVHCWDKQERDYCKDYLNKNYLSKAYGRYDDEHLK